MALQTGAQQEVAAAYIPQPPAIINHQHSVVVVLLQRQGLLDVATACQQQVTAAIPALAQIGQHVICWVLSAVLLLSRSLFDNNG